MAVSKPFTSKSGLRSKQSLGFDTGSGSSVTQLSNKSTGVTCNFNNGKITMNNATLGDGNSVSFILTNNKIATTDVVIPCISGGATAGAYSVSCDQVSAGSCRISLRNDLARLLGSLSETVVLNFVVVKGTIT